MGTAVSFVVPTREMPAPEARDALKEACRILHEADAVFSTWNPDSPMSRLRRGELALDDAPPVLREVLGECELARELSGGWFDPWAMPGGVDPTGLVKGWAAQRALEELRDAGLAAAMVNAGGDIACFGERPWRIGVRHPLDAEQLVCVAEVDGAIATSGGYERPGELLDPRTGEAAEALLQATVIGPDLALADAWATALVVLGEDGLEMAAECGYEAVVVTADGRMLASAGFPLAAAVPSV